MNQILAPFAGENFYLYIKAHHPRLFRSEETGGGEVKEGERMSQPVQERYEDSNLYRIRHSAAHIMAQAVLEMFPEGKITIGPPIENGFYYDFDLPRNLTPEDLEQIEKRMRQIIAGKFEFSKKAVSAEEARRIFKDQPYKIELIDGLEKGSLDET